MTRRRQPDDDELRALDVLDNLFCLSGSVEFLPPSHQVGWMEPGLVDGGQRYCVTCALRSPTYRHVPVYRESYLATQPCVVCGRRLELSLTAHRKDPDTMAQTPPRPAPRPDHDLPEDDPTRPGAGPDHELPERERPDRPGAAPDHDLPERPEGPQRPEPKRR